jgi:hypothetical protein
MTEELNEQLTPTQLKAIALLIEGKNDRETAEEVGVNRATVNTWRNQNQYFIAEYNSRINQLKDVIEATQHAVVLKAYSVLNKALDNELMKDEPDTRVALGVIRNYKGLDRLETNAETIENRKKARALNAESDYNSAMLFSSMGL